MPSFEWADQWCEGQSMFQPAVSVAEVLERVHSNEYLLPAIQREFVWNTPQIRALFDSVMRGYPIGSFLLWQVNPGNVGVFTFYNFITDYHEKDHPYAAKAHVPHGSGLTAVLDGQQRLTALNIGLYGSHAERIPKQWWSNPNAFPRKRLYLNLLADSDNEELGLTYDFRFLTSHDAKAAPGMPDQWFLVQEVLELEDAGPAIMQELETRRLWGIRRHSTASTACSWRSGRILRLTPTSRSHRIRTRSSTFSSA